MTDILFIFILFFLENASPAFKKFLNFLGENIELRGWKGYRAGLDVSGSNNTGTQSVYTKWQGYEIMFHVSTLLPFNEKDKQQVREKHHFIDEIHAIVAHLTKTKQNRFTCFQHHFGSFSSNGNVTSETTLSLSSSKIQTPPSNSPPSPPTKTTLSP
jgi:hypothetical protein